MSQEIQAHGKRRSGEEIRSAILDYLHMAAEQTGTGLTARQIGEAFDIHPTTARFHLERLVEQGEAVRQRKDSDGQSTGRGRPAVIYSPTFMNRVREDMISSLCMALETACPDTDSRDRAALKAGQVWGRALARQSRGNAEKDLSPSMTRTLLDTLATLGFAPVTAEPDSSSLYLTSCPFLDSVNTHPIICTIHLGMVLGLVENSSRAVKNKKASILLTPLSSPKGCFLKVAKVDNKPRRKVKQ
ncbi:helix-turn-helix transcriptional regulator [Bifidobacterium sp. 7101]|uniref:helix-turn-helix transcriptional regulator n=1 Tax=Bifidobacterium sp. 7101 TaxID=1394175 RepID=UPI0004A33233|nr:helix-turn-helix domain-containing protein [Bifidobacterium sp. 7101]